ncbi:monovalent cation/H(+) antiporter subunit G [Roseimaritima sediminicola]|uniref:monovalent cation/H(+) antiporter subunit G n=1 Tax=Roseimaritima sediminicola TaxID=2662066 RepID=UPI00129835E1|nr:monovalent cation/H(+) antiporter subunit G [Roseimaritima sediminicola]
MSLFVDILSWALLLAGSFFSIVGGIGIVRLPEFFSRMHGGGITDTLGAGLIVTGLIFQAGWTLVAVKLAAILFFLMITSPSSCHALARSALAHGLRPELDRRPDKLPELPGRRREEPDSGASR